MSDGVKNIAGQVIADVGEAVVTPVKDELGKAIEEGASTTFGIPINIDPLAQQKKREEEEKGKQQAEKVIDWYQKIDQAQAKVRQEKMEELQKKQQEENQQKQAKQYQVIQRQKQLPQAVAEAQRKTEVKKGIGG